VTTTVKVAHVRLCHSRMPFVRAYPREVSHRVGCQWLRHWFEQPLATVRDRWRTEMVFDAHDKAFAFFGGACARGLCDSSA